MYTQEKPRQIDSVNENMARMQIYPDISLQKSLGNLGNGQWSIGRGHGYGVFGSGSGWG